MRLTTEEVERLQANTANIRNICILAHVDHGKTSLSDSLLATNGIISQRMAGKVRYLDSREDEQLRGITMESSAISLYFKTLKRAKQEEGSTEEPKAEIQEHLINLIDSPGHIDFSSEVSTASRLCDGAVVLVDVVEGVCSQTVNVLREAWMDKLKPILVLNKIDRLIVELQMSSQEAYLHLAKVIEQVNSVIGSFFAGERMQDDLLWRERKEKNQAEEEFVEKDDSEIYFSPDKNNVIFASAIDGWGFNIAQFAVLYEKKLGIKRENLQKCLWGDFYFDPKTKKVISSKSLKGRNLKPLFVSLVLDNIWTVYDSCLLNRDQEKLEKIIKSLCIKILPRDLRSKDTKALLTQICSQWLPVSNAVLLTVIDKLPSPLESQKERISTILESAPSSELLDPQLKQDMLDCNRDGKVSIYVSKMVSIPIEELPQNRRVAMTEDELFERGRQARLAAAKAAEQARKIEESKANDATNSDDEYIKDTNTDNDANATDDFVIAGAKNNEKDTFVPIDLSAIKVEKDPYALDFEYEEDEDEEDFVPYQSEEESDEEEDETSVFIGFSRIYSGTIEIGQELTVLGPKFNPARPTQHISTITVTDLYLLMGRDLIAMNKVPAGNIIGIGGLAGKILKNGTLISPGTVGVNLAGVSLSSPPIVRVAVEPVNPTHMGKLERGLRLLNQADPCVQIFVEDSGEHILACAGQLHLERCIKDLQERFAGIPITASQPEVPYRETIIVDSEMNPPKNPELGRGIVNLKLGQYSITLAVRPLPEEVTEFLISNHASISKIHKSYQTRKTVDVNKNEDSDEEDEDEEDDDNLDAGGAISTNRVLSADELKVKLSEVLAEGNNKKWKDNIDWTNLVDRVSVFGPRGTGPNMLFDAAGLESPLIHRAFDPSSKGTFEYENSLLNGFQLACSSGFLANEPTQGVAVFVQSIETLPEEEHVPVPNLPGRILSGTRDMIHLGFSDWSPRIMLAMYTCDIQASAEVLGKVYAVVQKGRGRIVSEEMKEGTPFFTIEARLPVVEAFGFSEDIRKKTSGAASPQLIFAGFEMIDIDPFWVPTTEEELEELGEFAERENIARRYVNGIRKRKGLFVDEKVIKNAEKQRTLKKD